MIFSSEQGPDGGDELNNILLGKNYGWPYESYGWPYDKRSYNRKFNFGEHSNYEPPLFFWIPSIAVGDLKCDTYQKEPELFELWLATLRDKSLRRILVTSDGRSVITDERIPLGYRVRGILVDEKLQNITGLTDDGYIIEIRYDSYE